MMSLLFRCFIPYSAFPACPAGRHIPKLKCLLLLVFWMACLGLPEGFLHALPRVQRTVLQNGLVLLVAEEHSLPFVTLELLVDSGSKQDPSEKEGLAYLTAKGLLLGTSKHTVNAFNEELDFMGASLISSSQRDYASLNLRILKKDLEKGLDLFMEGLLEPTFPEDEIRGEVEKTLAAIQSAENDPGEVAEKSFQKTLFSTGPYGHPVEGTKDSLPRLTREEVKRFYRSHYCPNNAILTVVGNMTFDEVKKKLIPRLDKWPKGEAFKSPPAPSFTKEQKTVKIDRNITQANIILGHSGVSRDHPDYYTLMVMNYILGGGGFSSRLMEEVRVKRGLAYSVASFFDAGKYPGSFQIVLQTKNASAREAIALSLQQMEGIQKQGVTEKELEGAKKYLIGSFPLRFGTQGKMANFFSQVEYYGLGFDYPEKYSILIQSVTQKEVLRVAKKFLDPKNYILVVVANLKEAGLD